MDSGFLEPGETMDDDYDVLRDLSPEQVIGIMDQLLCHEVRSLYLARGLADVEWAGSMACRKSFAADSVHIHIYRQTSLAGAETSRASPISAQFESTGRQTIGQSSASSILYRARQSV